VTGPAREAGLRIAHAAIDVAGSLRPGDRPVCLLTGGETTVVVTGSGLGGRNQELVLAGAIALRGIPGITVASVGTDGVDGPTDAAGAIADGDSVERAERAGLDAALALDNNDSYAFFTRAGGHIVTGPTGTNVIDVQVALVDAPLDTSG
jgi:glycerate-2-kinase